MDSAESYEDQSSVHGANGTFYDHLEEKVRPYIDLIDSLRLIGIDKDLSLPAIAVIGDQSSGKSSVLEALSGVALPRGSGIVTRCPLELKLKKVENGRPWRAVISYKAKSENFTDPALVEKYVRQAQNELAGDGVGICHELISLEIMSPYVCDLTLIDLPGIARVPVGDQPEDIADQIKRLILNFIERSETINLVVVPCNVDIATTEALKMAKAVDPEGKRTLAILTKPDLIDKGAEIDVLHVVQGRVIQLQKGYMIVKCRGQSDINQNISLEEATRQEYNFFQQHRYFRGLLNDRKATTKHLAARLTQDLVEHIKKLLPYITEQIHQQLHNVKETLKDYECGPPMEPTLMATYLTKRLMQFNEKITALYLGGDSELNLYPETRLVFKEWFDYLSGTKQELLPKVKNVVDNYDTEYRGRELLTFNDCRIFLSQVQSHVQMLMSPAINVLKVIQGTVQKKFNFVAESSFKDYPNLKRITLMKIDEIHTKMEAKVEKRIKEYINMEKLVYSQDTLFVKSLNLSCDTFKDISSENCASYDVRGLTAEKLQAYYEIVFQRLANHIPMLILHFILEESAKQLCLEIMDMRADCNVCEMLKEDSEASTRRTELQQRRARLRMAQEQLLNF